MQTTDLLNLCHRVQTKQIASGQSQYWNVFKTNHRVFLWTFVLLISQSGFPCVYTKCVFGDYFLCHVRCSRGLFFLFGVKGHHYGGWWLQCICDVVICQSAHACDWCAVWQITTNFWQFPRLFHTAQSSTTESGFVIKNRHY